MARLIGIKIGKVIRLIGTVDKLKELLSIYHTLGVDAEPVMVKTYTDDHVTEVTPE